MEVAGVQDAWNTLNIAKRCMIQIVYRLWEDFLLKLLLIVAIIKDMYLMYRLYENISSKNSIVYKINSAQTVAQTRKKLKKEQLSKKRNA